MNKHFIGDIIFEFNKTLKIEIEREFKPLNIGAGQLAILLKLYEHKNNTLRQSELVSILGIDKSNASRNITKLEEKGLVEVFHINKRDKGVKLTERSENYKKKVIFSLKSISEKMTKDISLDDLTVVFRVIQQMNKNLE